jgi:uncharacterized protein YecE (DUF72 family)
MSADACGTARIGCSGWSYADWRGVVYPTRIPKREWFGFYASMFDTVELNSTFYRLPTEQTVETWAAAAPAGFVYALKLGAFGTHRMKLRDAASWLPKHVDRLERLGDSAGPTVVQLPPHWKRNVERLDELLSIAPRRFRWAVELRDVTWVHDDVFAVLERHGAALCIHDLLADVPFVLTTDWTYVRFHGPNAQERPYHGAYRASRLAPWAKRLSAVLDTGRDVYAYFNNDFEGHAVNDAECLRRALSAWVPPASVITQKATSSGAFRS